MIGYIYTPEELNLTQFSDGILRLNVTETRDPDAADIFICPEPLFKFTTKDAMTRLPHFYNLTSLTSYRRTQPHVFLDLSEHFTTYTENLPIFIRASLTKAMLEFGPNSISWPWPVKDFNDCRVVSSRQFNYDVTFHGYLSCLARKVSAKVCSSNPSLKADIVTYNNFYGYQDPVVQARRNTLYRNSIRQSRICLTSESIPGVLPYRFYEAMSAGHCQLYIGRNHNLPFADKIDYHDFVNFLDTDAADEADIHVKDWLTRYPDPVLIEKGKHARAAWEKWLQPDRWIDLMTLAVEQKLDEIKTKCASVS